MCRMGREVGLWMDRWLGWKHDPAVLQAARDSGRQTCSDEAIEMTEAWAIIDPNGEILIWTIHRYQDESIRMAAYNHIDLKTHDCVRVKVERI